ncbi:unnamed protein product [Cylindrotheca closterium]|uniref:Uncharacterized protein n=1 Tax=Cylindrotheca closterium TaxID=2856 RepID=A0AAD2FW60_9STRA|nr:unnamed protein product [Cylindrotheca closterium]
MINGNPIDWALRVCESIAFSLHCCIGLSEPWTGVMKGVTEGSLVYNNFFFPLAGIFLGTIAYLNFSSSNAVVIGVQCYIAAFHTGAVFTHLRVGHHPAAAAAPGIFIVLAFAVLAIRESFLFAVMATLASVAVGVALGFVLVKPKEEHSAPLLSVLEEQESE